MNRDVNRMQNKKLTIKYKIAIGIVFCMCLIIFLSYISGVRFTALQAAQVRLLYEDDLLFYDHVETGHICVFFYENEDRFLTVIAERIYPLPLWKSQASFYGDKFNDNLKLAGWCSYSNRHAGITAIPVQSLSNDVSYINMGQGNDFIEKKISYGETVIFKWDKMLGWNDLQGIAYTSDGNSIYELGYEIINNSININELRWLKQSTHH